MQLFGSLNSWWLSWAHLAPSLADLVPKWAPIKCPKMLTKGTKDCPSFFFLHFWEPFLRAILKTRWFNFGTQNGPGFLHKIPKRFTRETKMSPRGPSWALKSQTTAFKKPWKINGFQCFWVQRPPKRPSRNPRAAQEAPKELQRPKKNQPKKVLT